MSDVFELDAIMVVLIVQLGSWRRIMGGDANLFKDSVLSRALASAVDSADVDVVLTNGGCSFVNGMGDDGDECISACCCSCIVVVEGTVDDKINVLVDNAPRFASTLFGIGADCGSIGTFECSISFSSSFCDCCSSGGGCVGGEEAVMVRYMGRVYEIEDVQQRR